MKTLLVLRHGKSSWDQPIEDHERPLKARGKRAAVRMGQEIRNRGLVPEVICSSTARRARSTAKRAAKAAGYQGEIDRSEDLYFKGTHGHLGVISETSDSHQCIMVVGHNPDVEELVSELSGEDIAMPTAALACIDFDMESWSQIGESNGTLRFALKPRELD